MAYPYLELHDKLIELSKSLGYETYDYLPGDKANYPFVVIGEMFTVDHPTKSRTLADAHVVVHVWNYKEDMRESKLMCFELSKQFHENSKTENFDWHVSEQKGTFIFESDEATNSILSHGLIEIILKTR